ncbi:V-type ATPase V0 subunit e, putative [Plasmodium malariae]|uniref:V-type ATPase V0 subunit e, putative n=1 Tax=Plasmodium malariae TaxID=5858 RepID=A0A1D3JJ02_PLAMA|nr:V-type ATPase V0 subunit e, putative [Plasmodium malariae]SBT86327.1 V-type ATPase V0 subunit e, putative [Plasmodium malariae]
MDSNISTGTFIYLIIWFVSCILFCLFFARDGKISRMDMIKLIITLVSLAVFCLWIFWFCVYISQLNPMVSPQRRVIKE